MIHYREATENKFTTQQLEKFKIFFYETAPPTQNVLVLLVGLTYK
jgi:hypothetical protein